MGGEKFVIEFRLSTLPTHFVIVRTDRGEVEYHAKILFANGADCNIHAFCCDGHVCRNDR